MRSRHGRDAVWISQRDLDYPESRFQFPDRTKIQLPLTMASHPPQNPDTSPAKHERNVESLTNTRDTHTIEIPESRFNVQDAKIRVALHTTSGQEINYRAHGGKQKNALGLASMVRRSRPVLANIHSRSSTCVATM
ncbi:hypothetical protein NHQ30_010876 [Ciborinia camelliae]|nr:hypothetical protein NHQ30_010876 [Ciborinia camelliae]